MSAGLVHSKSVLCSTHPVRIIVPAGSVVPCDKNAIIFGMEKMRSLRVSVQTYFPSSLYTSVLHNVPTENTLDLDLLQVGD